MKVLTGTVSGTGDVELRTGTRDANRSGREPMHRRHRPALHAKVQMCGNTNARGRHLHICTHGHAHMRRLSTGLSASAPHRTCERKWPNCDISIVVFVLRSSVHRMHDILNDIMLISHPTSHVNDAMLLRSATVEHGSVDV